MPLEWWRWELARKMGWTLEYVDSLSLQDWHDYWQILDGEAKARKSLEKKPMPRARRRR